MKLEVSKFILTIYIIVSLAMMFCFCVTRSLVLTVIALIVGLVVFIVSSRCNVFWFIVDDDIQVTIGEDDE